MSRYSPFARARGDLPGGGFPVPPASGEVIAPGYAAATASFAFNDGDGRATALWLPAGTYDALVCHVGTAGTTGSVVRLGLWETDPAVFKPGALIRDAGTVSGESTGMKTAAITLTRRVGAWVWVQAVNQGGAGTRASLTYANSGSVAGAFVLPSGATSFPSGPQLVYGATGQTGALASTYPSGTRYATGAQWPLVGVRAA